MTKINITKNHCPLIHPPTRNEFHTTFAWTISNSDFDTEYAYEPGKYSSKIVSSMNFDCECEKKIKARLSYNKEHL